MASTSSMKKRLKKSRKKSTKKKKSKTIIGSWQIKTTKTNRVYEGDTQERLDEVRSELLAKGITFSFIHTDDRRSRISERGYTIWEI